MDKNHVTVNVAGRDFHLTSDENEGYVRRIAGYLDDKITEVQNLYPNLSTANCVILAALDISDELHKLRKDYNALDSRISELREMPRQSAVPVKRPFESKTAAEK